jgi:hypothetical protein
MNGGARAEREHRQVNRSRRSTREVFFLVFVLFDILFLSNGFAIENLGDIGAESALSRHPKLDHHLPLNQHFRQVNRLT